MRRRIALARARAPRPPDVGQRHAFGLRLFEAVPDRAPRAHVLRLLLRPHDLAQVRVPAHERRGALDRERVELLEARDCDVTGRGMLLVPDDVVVDLPLAEDETRDLLAVAARII